MSKRILIVDDDHVVVSLYEMELELRNTDIEVTSAGDVVAAIDVIEQRVPDLIVLDIRLPKGDGFEVLEHLKERNHKVPVVVLTNYDKDEYRERCATYGTVHEYVQKRAIPIHDLISKLQSYLEVD